MASKYHNSSFFPIPSGFHSILEAFALEILRDQPKDIILYGAEYFRDIDKVKNIIDI